jgi:hypothetical protein
VIPVAPAPEPATFDAKVRQKGEAAMLELIGKRQPRHEWSNYRLAAALINSKKSDLELVLDPFAIGPGLFALDFLTMEVEAGPAATAVQVTSIDDTIKTLGLNLQDCIDQRSEYYVAYKSQEISLRWLERRAPFIAQELRRQGRLNPGDA